MGRFRITHTCKCAPCKVCRTEAVSRERAYICDLSEALQLKSSSVLL